MYVSANDNNNDSVRAKASPLPRPQTSHAHKCTRALSRERDLKHAQDELKLNTDASFVHQLQGERKRAGKF